MAGSGHQRVGALGGTGERRAGGSNRVLPERYALIAGNGRFPLLALETAAQLGHDVVAIGIREEASPEIEALAAKCYWISIGQLSKLIETFQQPDGTVRIPEKLQSYFGATEIR